MKRVVTERGAVASPTLGVIPDLTPGFTSRYGVGRLVWFEEHGLIASAIHREKRLKKYPRAWKLNLIEELNPGSEDISGWLV